MASPVSPRTPNRADHSRPLRRPSWASSTTDSLDTPEPRHPPPEYRHYSLQSQRSLARNLARTPYIQEMDAEYAVDADESEDEDTIDNLGLLMPTRTMDSGEHNSVATPISSEEKERSLYPMRGRRQPSRASSDIDIEVAAGSSISSMEKSHGDVASPGFGSNLKRSLQIDMKNLVGDSVANMSISPGSRDVVLAARRGMYIIDLETPLEVPRFLPQGGTWDVADVQWNPHPARAECIVSTSAEKLIIWNLLLPGKSNIQHILQAHYRAVTDINWHTTEHDTIVSSGIDSWLWAWDLREPRKPMFGLSAFKPGGTQVKWNRKDGNILASSHANEVYVWDRRKGSLPVVRIHAHNSKIYGIDWSHDLQNEIITCSLDRSIKVWDVAESFTSGLYSSRPTTASSMNHVSTCEENEHNIHGPMAQYEPKRIINTTYPVWRARYLPFGKGLLSLPQRGEMALEMYALHGPVDNNTPVEVFEGHTDVVKEFVWRKGGHGDFQLITWSKDRTLKFWPIDAEIMQKVGFEPDHSKAKQGASGRIRAISFRNLLDGTRRRFPQRAQTGIGSVLTDGRIGNPPGLQTAIGPEVEFEVKAAAPINIQAGVVKRLRGQTMSRGPMSVTQVDAFTWLANVKVGDRKGSNSRGPSREGSESRVSSRSRLLRRDKSAVHTASQEEGTKRKRSESRSRTADLQDTTGQALQDEITTVLPKLKIKLEKHDLMKKRTCTLGLHGPWGENSQLQVFIRVTFTFPRDYPYAKHPNGIPTVEVERNPLIPIRNRAFMLRRLRTIRERRRPCLEACLRFLLFGDAEEGEPGPVLHLDSGSSSDESNLPSAERKKRKKEIHAISMLRTHKNLAEPRTSQGTFGPNGELICFFRASPRIVRNVLRGLTNSSANAGASDSTPLSPPRQLEELPQASSFLDPGASGVLRTPSLVSDAVTRLAEVARDRGARSPSAPRHEGTGMGGEMYRVLNNMVAFAQQGKVGRDSEGAPQQMTIVSSTGMTGLPGGIPPETGRNYALSASRSTVFLVSANDTAGPDKSVAIGYTYACEGGLREVCDRNAQNARACGRYDHERVFKVLKTLFPDSKRRHVENEIQNTGGTKDGLKFTSDTVAKQLVMKLYTDFAKDKDIQMLAMLSTLLLQTSYCSPESLILSLPIFPPFSQSPDLMSAATVTQGRIPSRPEGGFNFSNTSSMLTLPKVGPVDYFSITRAINSTVLPPSSPDWPRLPNTSPQPPPSIPMTPSASRGTWSTLFGAAGVRQFVQDTFNKEGQIILPEPIQTDEEHKSQKRPIRPVSAGARPSSDVGILSQKQQPLQRKGRQKRNSIQMPHMDLLAQQQGFILSGVTPLTRSSTSVEVMPPPLKASLSFSSTSSSGSASMRRSPLTSVDNINLVRERERKRVLVFQEEDVTSSEPLFDRKLVDQFKAHVEAYAEILHRWKMDHQRLELLKAVNGNISSKRDAEASSINITRVCTICLTMTEKGRCPTCGSFVGALRCSVCRLPAKGLSRTCLLCYHTTHISCIQNIPLPICPTGCGCMCDAWYNDPESKSAMPGAGMVPSSISNSGQRLPSTRASSVMAADSVPEARSAHPSYLPTLSLLLS